MTNVLKISKAEAARRQIDTAIELFFAEKDPISIHVLMMSAWQILKELPKKTEAMSGREMLAESFPDTEPKEIYDELKRAYNFFKHGKSDADEILEFNHRPNRDLLLFTIHDFAAHSKLSYAMQVFHIWWVSGGSERNWREYSAGDLSHRVMKVLQGDDAKITIKAGLAALNNPNNFKRIVQAKKNEIILEDLSKGINRLQDDKFFLV